MTTATDGADDLKSLFDPDMAAAMARMVEIVEEKGLTPPPPNPDPIYVRERMEDERAWWNEDLPEMAEVLETNIPGPGGDLRLRILYPEGDRPMRTIVFYHGGGWVIGSLETHHRAMRCLAIRSGCAIVAVDYRLAPEARYPGPLEDCLAATRYVMRHGGELGLDTSKVVLAGDSAGANLAMATALRMRDAGEDPAKALICFYGAFGVDFDTSSYDRFGDGTFGLGRAMMVWFWDLYLRDKADYDDPYAVPMKANLAGLPPTHLYAAGLDPLLDDSVSMSAKLRAAGVPGQFKVYPGVCHAFINLTRMVKQAHELIDDASVVIAEHLD
ncbi:MAG: alpha/beta hydrolase fold domain-containing protein [Rhodospirillaceae bacterium]|jgi:acetyl esterase|nr:alpha/beta hydrolase fold domain-containing protein [Rhodospirillaceae bacterium]